MSGKKTPILLFSFFIAVCFYSPVFASFFHAAHNLTNSQITILFACFSLSTFIFEIPSGLLGDRIGEKIALIIGCGLTFLSTLFFIIGNYYMLYAGEIILGLGGSFFSGPFEALIYRYGQDNDIDLDYSKLVSKIYSIQYLALFFSFAGCFLLTMHGNVAFPFYATLAANASAFVLAFFIPEVKIDRTQKVGSILRLAVTALRKDNSLRGICLISALFTMLLTSGYLLLQPYLLNSVINPSYNGALYLVAALFGSCGSFSFDKLKARLNSNKRLVALCVLLISICFLALFKSYDNVLYIAFLVCFYRLIWGITSPLFVYLVNKQITAESYRDTIFSIISLISNLVSALLLFLLGLFEFDSRINYLILGLLTLVLLLTSLYLFKYEIHMEDEYDK